MRRVEIEISPEELNEIFDKYGTDGEMSPEQFD
jgi:hypothetical protein